ncbi:MAG: hypothetical protein KKH94_00650 [Candidatus Omnitrophica bacterium]|nr:hypothetical protein [Candidatus Omnitrophota bacterium]
MYSSNKQKRNSFILYFLWGIVITFVVSSVAEARVDKDIQDEYEKRYEDKVFILREDLRIFHTTFGEPEFITDLEGFVYPDDKEELKENILFAKGTKIIIEKFDFDIDEIEITIRSIESNREGSVVFRFNERFSASFDGSPLFVRRFDEIFLKESLKKFPVSSDRTDRVKQFIEKGEITIGITRDEVLLTLGKPFDIVKHMRQDGTTQEDWIYKENLRTYSFSFENGILEEWFED